MDTIKKASDLNVCKGGNTVGHSGLIIDTILVHSDRSDSSGVDLVVCSSGVQCGASSVVNSRHISYSRVEDGDARLIGSPDLIGNSLRTICRKIQIQRSVKFRPVSQTVVSMV